MTTKYYYNGKLARTSTSKKLSYSFAIYNDKDGDFANFSRDYDRLAIEIMRQREMRQRIVDRKIAEGETSGEWFERAENMLKWWNGARIVKLDKAVTE